jgi:hypothetical protein
LAKTKELQEPTVVSSKEEVNVHGIVEKRCEYCEKISKKYGDAIDLKESPSVLLEILRSYGHVLDDPDGGGGGGGGVSSIAVAGPPCGKQVEVQLADVMKAISKLQRDVKTIGKTVNQRVK